MKFFSALLFSLIYLNAYLLSENTLQVFSESEKESIEYLFDYLFKFESFTYTLFGEKPISFEEIYPPTTNNTSIKNYSILLSYTKPINFLETSWNLWQSKYSKVKFKNYIFFDKKKTDHSTIILINKKAFSKTFEANKITFQLVLGKDLTEEKLLNRIIAEDFSLKESLNNHEGLLGILLGYGTHNSMLFQEKKDFLNFRNKIISPEIIKNGLPENKKLSPTNKSFGWVNIVQPLSFMAKNDHPETKKLIKKYSKTNSKASQFYKNHKLVDVIISKLTEEP